VYQYLDSSSYLYTGWTFLFSNVRRRAYSLVRTATVSIHPAFTHCLLSSNNPLLGESPYGYTPSAGVCITAIVLFSVSTAVHTAQAIYYSIQRRRRSRALATSTINDDSAAVGSAAGVTNVYARQPSYWWILATLVPGGLLEIVGWAGRYWSSQNVLNIQVFPFRWSLAPPWGPFLTYWSLQPFLMQICWQVSP